MMSRAAPAPRRVRCGRTKGEHGGAASVAGDGPLVCRYFKQRSNYQAAIDNGELLPPATNMDQMQQIVTNSTVNGVLQSVFALLVIVVAVNSIFIWVRALRAGGLPTTEVPHEPPRLVAPSDFFATKEEKEAVRQYELAQAGGPR
jgi:carbon starvation protein